MRKVVNNEVIIYVKAGPEDAVGLPGPTIPEVCIKTIMIFLYWHWVSGKVPINPGVV